MTYGLAVGNYVNLPNNFAKIIGIEDHFVAPANLHLAVLEDDDTISQLKVQANEVTLAITLPEGVKEKLDSFVPVRKVTLAPKPRDIESMNQREYEVQEAIRKAVNMADRIILEASDGSCEETDFMTYKVAEAFLVKIGGRLSGKYLAMKLGLTVQPGK